MTPWRRVTTLGCSWMVGCALLGSSMGCNAGAGDESEDGSSSGSTAGTAAGGTGSAVGGTGSGAGGIVSGTGGTGSGAGGSGIASTAALSARAWRLSHAQYAASVVDLVGVEPSMENFQPESGNGKFSNFSSTNFVGVDLAANYYDVAKDIAEGLTTVELIALSSCDLSATCKEAFISEVGEKAFRSAVPVEVATRLSEIFDLAASEVDDETGFRAMLLAILNSPLFLYRKEIGPEAEALNASFDLTQDQVAEFLSFSLLNSPPPAWLREKALADGLDAAGVAEAIGQIMASPRFEEQLQHFLGQWLEVDHFESVEKFDVFPGFEAVKPFMEEELHAFLEQSGTSEATLVNLLLDPVPSVRPALDQFYYSDPSAPEEGERLGALQLGAVLASHAKTYLTSPTLRGMFIRERLFCTEITLPPGFTPPPLTETEDKGIATTTRELYRIHQETPVCAQCHNLTDNIGFALEEFDGAGRFRTEDSTQGPSVPLDLETEITDSDVDRPLSSARDLSVALSESTMVKECLAQQAFRFYFGQVEESVQVPAVAAGAAGLVAGGNLGGLAEALMSTENTFTRNREETQ